MNKWQKYSNNFLTMSTREQYLIILTGLIAIIFITYSFFLEPILIKNSELHDQTTTLISTNKSIQSSISIYEEALTEDPNKTLNAQVLAYKKQLKQIDEKLLRLTSELINPIQMRFALIDMLKVQKGVSLLSFELLGAKPLMANDESTNNNNSTDSLVSNSESTTTINLNENLDDSSKLSTVNLYQHGIRLKLSGKYFQLRDYLVQIEAMSWKFFWKDFQYKIKEYPLGELEIEIYSLSINEEFIGV